MIDQIGTQHFFKITPTRIVSLVPSQTELLFDLGLELGKEVIELEYYSGG
jgi:ABC-type Fe3+-hydroxamate transport system substrate-binding protein